MFIFSNRASVVLPVWAVYDIITSVGGAGGVYPSGDWVVPDDFGNLFISAATHVLKFDTYGNLTTEAGTPGITGFGQDDVPATQTKFGGISGLGWDPVAKRLLISDPNRIRQIFYIPPTTTALSASPNPALPSGGQVTLTATVNPSGSTGSVRFYQDGLLAGSAPLSGGVATLSINTPPEGAHPLRAVYGGDATHNLSASPDLVLNVEMGQSSTALSSSPNPSTQGQTVTFTATVTPAAATGSVEFRNGGNILGNATLSNGVATFTSSTLPDGLNSITARYVGNSQYAGSVSPAISQTVKITTTTLIASSPNPSTFAATVTLSATVAPSAATGTVQFYNGNVLLGSATLSGGQAQLTTNVLPAGVNSLTAAYPAPRLRGHTP